MKTTYRLLAVLLAGVVATSARAQAPAAAMPSKIYTKRMAFKLPFRIDDKERAELREVKLYVKNGPSEPWMCKETAQPTQTDFTYHVSSDGEYWFSVVTVDRMGRTTPADVSREPPGLVVVVDTRVPDFEIKPMTLANGETVLACRIMDANPDPSKTRLEYRLARDWQALDPVPDHPDMFRVPDPTLRGLVRATVCDRAGNSTTREVNLMGTRVGQGNQPPSEAAASAMSLKLPGMSTSLGGPGTSPTGPILTTDYRTDKVPAPALPSPTLPAPSAARVPSGASVQVINSTHASLEYQVDNLGPSGIGKVEIWITRDEGLTWTRLCEDPDRKSPADIDLPGEGLYGIALVVTNGGGTGATPPVKGDSPDWWVEVDMTKPQAQLTSVRACPAESGSAFLINWTASDKNLKTEPIDLYVSHQLGGTWTTVAHGQKNTGTYRWPVPKGAGPEFYFRMDVTDRAGNVTRCETSQPMVLDPSRPKAHVLGVAASAMARPLGSCGN